jgi:hypothetical protein
MPIQNKSKKLKRYFMAERINYRLQDSEALLVAVDSNREEKDSLKLFTMNF